MAKDNGINDDIEFDISTARLVPGSLVHQLCMLNIGESIGKVRAPDPTTTMAQLANELPAMRDQLRNACSPSMRRARETSGYSFTCEIGEAIMPGGSYYIVAVITRTA